VLDRPVIDDQREALEQRHSTRFEGRQLQRPGEFQMFVGQDGKRKVQAFCGLFLVGGILRRQAEQVINAEVFQFRELVAERARLRRAAPRARDHVPTIGVGDAGSARSGVGVDHGASAQGGKIDSRSIGRGERHRGQSCAGQMFCGTVILRRRDSRPIGCMDAVVYLKSPV
jgi:hypothetical protein